MRIGTPDSGNLSIFFVVLVLVVVEGESEIETCQRQKKGLRMGTKRIKMWN